MGSGGAHVANQWKPVDQMTPEEKEAYLRYCEEQKRKEEEYKKQEKREKVWKVVGIIAICVVIFVIVMLIMVWASNAGKK